MSDFNLLAEAMADGFSYIRKSKGNVQGQYNGPCIVPSGCGGTGRDRLRIQPNVGKYGRFVCSICGTSGSGIDWLMLVRGMSKFEALTYVGWQPADGSPLHTPQSKRESADLSLSARSEKWRINAFNLARLAHAKMDDETRTYLHERGISDTMIRKEALGYYDHYHVTNKQTWGENRSGRMIIPRGIVIPWIDGEQEIRCVRIRRLPSDESDEARTYYGVDGDGKIRRYRALYGVDSRHFYNEHRIEQGCKVAVFEGEFTSLVAQEAVRGQNIVCVATGSTSWCHNNANLRLLASCSQVLICFDTDENQAGEHASDWWLDRLENAKRWRPLWGDANDMAMDGVDVQGWLLLGFEQDQDTTPPVASHDTIEISPDQDEKQESKRYEAAVDLLVELSNSGVELCFSANSHQLVGTELDAEQQTSYRQRIAQLEFELRDILDVPQRELTRDEMAERYRGELQKQGLSDWTVEVMTKEEWEAHKVMQIKDQTRPAQKDDFWTQLEARLERRGYNKEFKAKEQELLNRVETPHVYPCPVPRYELQEDENGRVHLVIVGYWYEEVHA